MSKKDAACGQINDSNRDIPVQTIPAPAWQTARSTPPCDPETNPAVDPPRWERFFNLDYASLAVISDCTEAGREARLAMDPDVEGGLVQQPRQRLHLLPSQPRVRPPAGGPGNAAQVPEHQARAEADAARRAALLVAVHRRVAGDRPHPRLPLRSTGEEAERTPLC